ncbi:M23 family metallopeptidase [Microbacterium thalli]|uniref:M23 family metallopeptidase n=1 Tax=Microbacterium thalli TaxID=3027921 RepID=A0ABT5SJX7_9MICO|nr:M23 family metallopeptidase [Microbacterium thalli]MDD7963105.1 M23 family metallopeptidase [Microbacterium thalli]
MAGPGAALVLLNPKVVRVVIAAGVLVLASIVASLFLLVAVFSGSAQGTTPQPAPTGPGTVFPVTGEWTTPVGGPYSVTSRYGYRPNVVPHDHFGVDLAQGCGQPILAAAAGEVTFAGFAAGGWGERVKIKHSETVTTAYAHLTSGSITVKQGDRVVPGQVIGAEGATGVGTGCHLHFEVYLDGKRINPEPFMAQQGIVF